MRMCGRHVDAGEVRIAHQIGHDYPGIAASFFLGTPDRLGELGLQLALVGPYRVMEPSPPDRADPGVVVHGLA
ncbi:hypothetical protein ABZY93_21030 [Streptomyces smyrnaeus]|uniref:hypothetical protein n=1 Tax=Streptomyces smyrnaeus TaxID=1387713 RepID=UPI0033B048A3